MPGAGNCHDRGAGCKRHREVAESDTSAAKALKTVLATLTCLAYAMRGFFWLA
jgi:hypothetical protein